MSDKQEFEAIISTGSARGAHDEAKAEDRAGGSSSWFTVGLSADQHLRVETWFKEKWDHGKCPVCGTDKPFLPPDRIWQLRPLDYDPAYQNRIAPNPVFPCFAVVCSNCGYTIWINAAVAGTLP